jgi:hypothetical protein
VSQLLTLYTTPVVYIYLDRLTHVLGRLRHGGEGHYQIVPAHPAE